MDKDGSGRVFHDDMVAIRAIASEQRVQALAMARE